LIGYSNDPTKLTGEIMNQEDTLRKAKLKNNSLVICYIYLNAMWLSYMFGKYQLAAEMADNSNIHEVVTSKIEVCNYEFCRGLIALALEFETREKKWRKNALDSIAKLKEWSDSVPWNFEHKLELLNAEFYFLSGDKRKAAQLYDHSISLAHEHRFIHDEALICERAGHFQSFLNNNITASEYYTRSYQCYMKWGAEAKALHVQQFLTSSSKSKE